MSEGLITPRTFAFLRELARHNNREWFNANKERYIDEVRDPLLAFVAAFAPRLSKISKHMLADPRPMGGSLFRIHRDTRFSHDKRPYKTQAALSFRHSAGRDVHGPIFYLHIEPGRVFMGAGMWRPEPDTLAKVRDAIVAHSKRWKQVLNNRGAVLDDGHEDSRLKRPPRGYDPEHPFIEDLMRKSFIATTPFTEAQACAADFVARYAKACEAKSPLMQFLAAAVRLPW